MVYFGFEDPSEVVIVLCVLFVFAILTSGFIRITTIYHQTKFAFTVGHVLSTFIFQSTLNKNYKWHSLNNSSFTITAVTQKSAAVVANFIMPMLAATTACMFLIFVMLAGIFIQPYVTVFVLLLVGTLYLLIVKFVGQKILENGLIVNEKLTVTLRVIRETLSSIRDVIINQNQSRFLDEFVRADKSLKTAQAINSFFKLSPKLELRLLV